MIVVPYSMPMCFLVIKVRPSVPPADCVLINQMSDYHYCERNDYSSGILAIQLAESQQASPFVPSIPSIKLLRYRVLCFLFSLSNK